MRPTGWPFRSGRSDVAEGIEDEASRQQLAELGCDQGQDYLFARPMPAAQFEREVLRVL
jgi:EAL domain-containing protein (putative c-di-GMP-specific phosphodiesterase class I)